LIYNNSKNNHDWGQVRVIITAKDCQKLGWECDLKKLVSGFFYSFFPGDFTLIKS